MVDVQLRPNRRALFIGVAILVIGVIALLAVVLGGGAKEPDQPAVTPTDPSDNGSAATGSNITLPVESTLTPDAKPVEEFIAIHIVSDPRGAAVMLDGAKIGVTPFDDKVKRGTKVAQLAIHLDGYVDFTSKVDLAGDEYTNDKIKLAKIPPIEPTTTDTTEPAATGSDATVHTTTTHTDKPTGHTGTPTGHTTTTTTHTTTGATTHTGTTTSHTNTGTSHTTPAPPPVKPCQAPDRIDPFDTRPICK